MYRSSVCGVGLSKANPLKGPIFISHPPTWIREQALGEKVDAGSDIFAFECMFYEMLTGVSPFTRDSAIASINAVVREEPPRLREVKLDLPCELEKIVHRCLQNDPNRRFQTAADLKVMLQEQNQETSQDRMLRCR
jgi:serine/threonine protein kinase